MLSKLLHLLPLLLMSLTLAIGQSIKPTQQDEKAIRATVDALVKSWANHDYSDMKSYTTPDADWVNIVGMWWKGRDAVAKAHQAYHDVMFKTTPMTTAAITIRLITPDVAIVHHLTNIGAYLTPGGHTIEAGQDLATLVLVKQPSSGKWLLTAGENVVVDAAAKKHDPVNGK